jgi:type IV pilus assembly protein PilE
MTSGIRADRVRGEASDNRIMHRYAPTPKARPFAAGVTLVELLVVVVILGVLAAIVLPSYQRSMYKSRRSDAMTGLAAMQQAQERYRGSCISYYPPASGQCSGADSTALQVSTSPSGWYTLSIVADSASASTYTLRATATSTGKQANDSACQIFEVAFAVGALTYRSYASGNALNGTPDPCWVK